jgi:hypothetical protein
MSYELILKLSLHRGLRADITCKGATRVAVLLDLRLGPIARFANKMVRREKVGPKAIRSAFMSVQDQEGRRDGGKLSRVGRSTLDGIR